MSDDKNESSKRKKITGVRYTYLNCVRCGTRTKFESGQTTKWRNFCPPCFEKFWSNPAKPSGSKKDHGLVVEK